MPKIPQSVMPQPAESTELCGPHNVGAERERETPDQHQLELAMKEEEPVQNSATYPQPLQLVPTCYLPQIFWDCPSRFTIP